MKVLSLDTKPPKALMATVGFFDGVHRGHRFLFQQLQSLAHERNLAATVITFPVHPRKILNRDYQPALLCGYEEKTKRIGDTELVDYIFPIHFTEELSKLSAYDFMKYLKEELNVKSLLVGYDHRFGHNREDGIDAYLRYGKKLKMEVIEAKELEEEIGLAISSSSIRRALAAGDIRLANVQLGYQYSITGEIVEGFRVGRTIGFPTANIAIWEEYKVVPALGAYAVQVTVNGNRYGGMLYIGTRPTVHENGGISIEVHLFDFDGDLYGTSLCSEFIGFVRPDEKFGSIDKLKEALSKDKITVSEILKKGGY